MFNWIIRKGINFLIEQKKKYGLFVKYYNFDQKLHKKLVKFDVDDNSVIPATLIKYGYSEVVPRKYLSSMKRDGLHQFKIKDRNNKDDFSEDGQIRLKPIFEALDSKLQYDAIKIAIL